MRAKDFILVGLAIYIVLSEVWMKIKGGKR